MTLPWLSVNRLGMGALPCTSMQAPPALISTMLQAMGWLFRSAKMVPFFGGHQITRLGAAVAVLTDFADHYAGLSIHLRMNGLLPPTAQKKPM